MKLYLFIFLFITASLVFADEKFESPELRKNCLRELEVICKKPKANFSEMRECLTRERLFISLKCEERLDYFYSSYSKVMEQLLKKCRAEILKFCTEDEIKDTSIEKFPICSRKFSSKQLSKPCEQIIDPLFR